MRVIDYLVKALYDAGVSTVLIPDRSIGHPAKLTADARDRFKDPVFIDDYGYLRVLNTYDPPDNAATAVKRLVSRILSAVELRRRGWRADIDEDCEGDCNVDEESAWTLNVYDKEGNEPVHVVIFKDNLQDPTTDEIEAALIRSGCGDECIGRESAQIETRDDKGPKT